MPLDTAVEVCANLLLRFRDANIPVIRLGLHDSAEVSKSHIGGIYHPAFRELCEAHIWLQKAKALLCGKAPGEYTLIVPQTCISQMTGQHKHNIQALKEAGYTVRVRGDTTLHPYEIQLKGGNEP